MNRKTATRLRRARRARLKSRELGTTRLCVHRTSQHMYAQVINAQGDNIVAQASTLEASLREGQTGNKAAAATVGTLIAKRAMEAGVKQVAFDRAGYKYHGRVKSLADAAREEGLVF